MCVESREWMKLGGKAFFCLTVSGLLEKGQKNPNVGAAARYLRFDVLRHETGLFPWDRLVSEVASLPTAPLTPRERQLAKQVCVCARYVLHKRATPPTHPAPPRTFQ